MIEVDRFSLVTPDNQDMEREYCRNLSFDGKLTGHKVPGDKLTRQYGLKKGYLLITEYDYFDGTDTWFYYLNADCKIKDSISRTDLSEFTKDFIPETDTDLTFEIYGKAGRWRLSVMEEGYWSFSIAHMAMRTNRFMFRKRFVSVERVSI